MGKLPYIPIYIGDWEQDTNCISIEAEGALIKLIFKLWKSPDKGLLLISFQQIAFLLKKSEEDAVKIVQELKENDVLNIEFLPEKKIKIESRRMIKEASKSATYSQNGSKGGRGNKKTKSKTKAKQKQNTEDEDENGSENDGGTVTANETEFEKKIKEFYNFRKQLKKPIIEASKQRFIDSLNKLSGGDEKKAIEILDQSIANGWQGIFQLKINPNGKSTFKNDREQRNAELTNLKEGSIAFLKRDRSQDPT